jgi:hypothetical protein
MARAVRTAAVTVLAEPPSSRGKAKLIGSWTTASRIVATVKERSMFEKVIGFITQLTPKGRAARATETLKANAEKALRMKQDAGPQTHIPEHQTAHEGAIRGGQINYTDTALGKEGTFTENTGRSRGARSGDAS